MIVHLTGSTKNFAQDILYFRQIMRIISEHKSELARDWIEDAYKRIAKEGGQEDPDAWGLIVQGNIEAIARADVVIIETTNMRFAQGYQAAVALQQKKPTLLLSRAKKFEGNLASGLTNDFLKAEVYSNGRDLERIVGRFLEENTLLSKDMRFNFFIDRHIYNYLRWTSLKTGKTKAEILRSLVEKEIDRSK